MKSCLVLSDLPVAYKVQNFNNENLSLIQRELGNHQVRHRAWS